eukprot:4103482-Prymnesium_polylepis.2
MNPYGDAGGHAAVGKQRATVVYRIHQGVLWEVGKQLDLLNTRLERGADGAAFAFGPPEALGEKPARLVSHQRAPAYHITHPLPHELFANLRRFAAVEHNKLQVVHLLRAVACSLSLALFEVSHLDNCVGVDRLHAAILDPHERIFARNHEVGVPCKVQPVHAAQQIRQTLDANVLSEGCTIYQALNNLAFLVHFPQVILVARIQRASEDTQRWAHGGRSTYAGPSGVAHAGSSG